MTVITQLFNNSTSFSLYIDAVVSLDSNSKTAYSEAEMFYFQAMDLRISEMDKFGNNATVEWLYDCLGKYDYEGTVVDPRLTCMSTMYCLCLSEKDFDQRPYKCVINRDNLSIDSTLDVSKEGKLISFLMNYSKQLN